MRIGNLIIDTFEYFYLLIPLVVILIYLFRKQYLKEAQRIYSIKLKKFFIFLLRIVFFTLLILSISGPHYESAEKFGNVTKIKVLIDKSQSMDLLNTEDVYETLDKIDITKEVRELDMGDYTSLGNSILNNLAPNENILVISDGQNNFGSVLEDVALFSSTINSRLFSIDLRKAHDDAAISITGPNKVVSGVENTYEINLDKVGNPEGQIKVYVDDFLRFEKTGEFEFKETFTSGTHIIKAEFIGDDYFSENNVYYKTIYVYKKPKVLFVSRKNSPLLDLYRGFYDVDVSQEISELDGYYAVVLNNIDSRYLTEDNIDALDKFVEDGNGLFVIGGKNSFDYGDYNKSLITNLLPVAIGKAQKKQDITNIVILMDTGASGSEVLVDDVSHFDIQKSLAVDIIRSVSDTNKVSVVEANYYLNRITGISEIGPKREEVVNLISLLTPHGFSELRFAYENAHQALKFNKGSKNIVIITDGLLTPFDQEMTLGLVENAHNDAIKTFIIGVGDNADEEFLIQVKEKGGGEYFRAYEKDKIKIYFGTPGEGNTDQLEVFVYDSNHFITKGITDLSRIYGFNNVYPKNTARLLLTTSAGDPILTVWNYGVGRVAAFSTDDGSLWVPGMLGTENSKALIKTLNWLIEDPERKNDIIVDIPELRAGENFLITVKSNTKFESDMNFYEISKDIYQTNYYVNDTGIHNVLGQDVGVNYKKELLNIGTSEDFKKILEISGGTMLEDDHQKIKETLQSLSEVETIKSTDMSWVFLVAALIIYLFEIFVRRIFDMGVK